MAFHIIHWIRGPFELLCPLLPLVNVTKSAGNLISSFLCVVFMVAMLLLLLCNKFGICMNAIVATASFLKQFHQVDLFTAL